MVPMQPESAGRGERYANPTFKDIGTKPRRDHGRQGYSRRDVQVHDVHKIGDDVEEGKESQTTARSEELIYPKYAAPPHAQLDTDARHDKGSPSLPKVLYLRESPSNNNGILEDLAKLDPCLIVMDTSCIALLRTSSLDPPVTAESLRELDLFLIKNNLSLRIDLNYNHNLHFMPTSGRWDEGKRDEARRYWQCIVLELRMYRHDNLGECPKCKGYTKARSMVSFPSRLPAMFEHIKALILLLVPGDAHQQVQEIFGVDFLVQQLRRGMLDAGGLARCLKALLTAHCAPIRDEKAEEMVLAISDATMAGDTLGLVKGLDILFAFLECMRLDIANHQIKTYRNSLIEDGIAFQIDYFKASILQRKLNVEGSRQWFLRLCEEFNQILHKKRAILACGLTRLCTSEATHLPITFKYDESRLHIIQQELRDEVHLRVCRKVYQHILTMIQYSSSISTLSRKARPFRDGEFSISRIVNLTNPLLSSPITLGNTRGYSYNNNTDTWHTNIDLIAMEIMHQVSLACPSDSATLLTANFSTSVLKMLQNHFEEEYLHHEQATQLERELRERVLRHFEKFDSLRTLEITEAQNEWQQGMTGPGGIKSGPEGAVYVGRTVPDMEDVARRIAHISMVNWRVWKRLSYLHTNFDGSDAE